jgi:lipopolysaccharide export system protein LptA
MKRKLILLGGTFFIVLSVVIAYQVFFPSIVYDEATDTDAGIHQDLIPDGKGGVADPTSPFGYDLKIIETDTRAPGTPLKRIYYVKYWKKRDDGVYELQEPRVTLYQKDGQEITISSKTGEVVAEWIEGKPKVISGFLAGDVKIFIDRTKDYRRRESLPPEKRPEVVRIYTEKLSFSNPDLKIHTEEPIKLFSKEGDIFGKGLVLSWSENPRELRQLKIVHGQKMIVHNAGGKSPVLMVPGQKTDPEDQAVVETQPAAATVAAVATPASAAASQPTDSGMRSNVFVANFYAGKKDVYVHSGDRRMEGAKKLSLTFEFEPSSSSVSQPEKPAEADTPVGPIDPDALDHGPIDVPDSVDLSGTEPAIPLPDSGKLKIAATAPAVEPTTKPAATSRPARSKKLQPLIIEWDGPLVLVPKGHTPKPSRKRYNIVAKGDTVTLSDKENTASCVDFTYNNLSQIGTLKGDANRPAELLTAQNERIVSEVIKFDRANGHANLEGKGYMIRQIAHTLPKAPTSRPTTEPATRPTTQIATRPATQPTTQLTTQPATRPTTQIATRPATQPTTQAATQPADQRDRIDWSESVLAIFGTDKASGSQYIKETTFNGSVKLRQGKTGDFVNCDKLYVQMERNESGSVKPARAIATGNAVARQQGSDISADKITVTFKGAPDAKKPEGDERVSQRVKPAILLAEGNVKVRDDRGKEPVSATADRLESDVGERSAILTGAPASLSQGPNTLSGLRIELRQERLKFTKPGKEPVIETRHYAKVIGRGDMKFMTDKDLSGRTLADPKPIKITWSKGMDYHPKEIVGGVARAHSSADFKGDVTVDSGDDHMECREMEALFVEPTRRPEPTAATMPSGPVALEGTGGPVTMANYSQRKLIKLTANEKVVLTSKRTGPNDVLLRRMRLRGKRLVYNTITGIVNMDKAGAMLAEDYRKPAPKTKAAADDTQRMERPMLTLFKWDDSMELSQKERVVIMKGKVEMMHRSGKFVLSRIQGLKVPDYGKEVPLGRKTTLHCDEMLSRFDPPKETKKTKKTKETKKTKKTPSAKQPTTGPSDALDVGPKIGALKLFNAIGNVNLTDGGKQIVGQRLLYSRDTELVQVYGYLPDQPKADAMIIDKDRVRNTEKIVKSPKILWWRATKDNGYREKIEAEGVSVD